MGLQKKSCLGVLDNEVIVDLEYEEDSKAEVDMNFIMIGSGSVKSN
jgi:ribonuclease PH